jgi:hypothetical protein
MLARLLCNIQVLSLTTQPDVGCIFLLHLYSVILKLSWVLKFLRGHGKTTKAQALSHLKSSSPEDFIT